jgi:hypothetical protein
LSKEERWYKVVKPRASSVCMGRAAGVRVSEQSFSKFIIRGVDVCRDRSVSKLAI